MASKERPVDLQPELAAKYDHAGQLETFNAAFGKMVPAVVPSTEQAPPGPKRKRKLPKG